MAQTPGTTGNAANGNDPHAAVMDAHHQLGHALRASHAKDEADKAALRATASPHTHTTIRWVAAGVLGVCFLAACMALSWRPNHDPVIVASPLLAAPQIQTNTPDPRYATKDDLATGNKQLADKLGEMASRLEATLKAQQQANATPATPPVTASPPTAAPAPTPGSVPAPKSTAAPTTWDNADGAARVTAIRLACQGAGAEINLSDNDQEAAQAMMSYSSLKEAITGLCYKDQGDQKKVASLPPVSTPTAAPTTSQNVATAQDLTPGTHCPALGSDEFYRANGRKSESEGWQMVDHVPGKPCGGWHRLVARSQLH